MKAPYSSEVLSIQLGANNIELTNTMMSRINLFKEWEEEQVRGIYKRKEFYWR